MSSDLLSTMGNILEANDIVHLALMVLVVCVAGLGMPNLKSIIPTTIVALLTFAIASTATTAALGGAQAVEMIESDWSRLGALNPLVIVAYILVFMLMIVVVHLLGKMATRR